MKKLKIGVLMGGRSIEKEVSFSSGRTICDHIDTQVYSVVPLFQTHDNILYILPWRFLHRGKISDFEKRLELEAQKIKWDDLKNLIDFTYIALHGTYGEDGTIQGILELLDIPYLGSDILASAICMDKIVQKKLLDAAGIRTPRGCSISYDFFKNHEHDAHIFENIILENKLHYPLFVKPQSEGSSLGISVVHNDQELLKALSHAIHISSKKQGALVEEQIHGREFTTVALFDKNNVPFVMPPTEIIYDNNSLFFDYTQKYMPGKAFKITPAPFTQDIIEAIHATTSQVSKILDLKTLVRIDGFVTPDNTIVIIEVNTLCGMAPSSFVFNQAAQVGMSHTDFINYLLTLELGISMNSQTDTLLQTPSSRLKIAVLMGGNNNERETSLNSGRNICYKLSPHAYEVIPIFVDHKKELYPLSHKLLVHNATHEIEHELDRSTKIAWNDLPKHADFVFIGLHGGAGENGSVQAMLEMLELPYNGSGITTSALCMDKYKTSNFLKIHEFNVPHNILISHSDWMQKSESLYNHIIENFTFPIIIKPHNDGCSFLVSKVNTPQGLSDTLNKFFKETQTYALIEEHITGMELTVGVIGNETVTVLPPSYTVTHGDILSIEEKFLPGAGENQTPAPLPPHALEFVKNTIKQVYITLGCSGYARIDCFYQEATFYNNFEEKLIILEVNTLPALTPATCFFHQTAECGINPMETIDMIVKLGLEKHAKQKPRISIHTLQEKSLLHE